MGFIKTIPIKLENEVIDATTTNTREKQIWQDLISIRFLNKPKGIAAKKATAPWIDQAKVYYLDACKSDWRSSGLLYYYSFLNLAKAYLAAKKSSSAKVLLSTNVYHGLSVQPQSPMKIIDYEIQIHPPIAKGKSNIFAKFYEALTGTKWPHSSEVTIRLSDVVTYCNEISTELANFYGLTSHVIYAYSLIRDDRKSIWFEINVQSGDQSFVQKNVTRQALTPFAPASMSNEDKSDWLTAYDLTVQSFIGTVFLRTPVSPYTAQNRSSTLRQVHQNAVDAFGDFALPIPMSGTINQFWQFIPKIGIGGSQILWHPFLSEYLVAFALSTILRYQPHLLKPNTPDSFIAEAWCSQSAITALRYYLMSMTTPSLRYN